MPSITAIILCFNEEIHLERCINSLSSVASRICVIDSYSSDNTQALAKKLGAEVYCNPWTNYSDQFTWALNNCNITSDWVMRIDADEILEDELRSSVREFVEQPGTFNSAFFRRKIVFLGQPIKHGFFYPALMLRLWRTGIGRIEQRWMDEHIVVDNACTKVLPGDLTDHNLNDLSWWTRKHDSYASREVYDIVFSREKGSHTDTGLSGSASIKRLIKTSVYNRLPPAIRALMYFMYRYILGMGFLDGKAGLYFHVLQAFWYRLYVDAKLYELNLQATKQGMSMADLLRKRGIREM